MNEESPFRGWTLFFCGICMGAADLVPGISGGTIAFILGFYQPLLESLKSFNWEAFQLLFRGHVKAFAGQVGWRFLLTLIAGILTAFICLANLFHFILSHEVYRIYLYALFLGLILASFVFCMRQVRVWDWKIAFGIGLGVISAYFLTESTLTTAQEGPFAIALEIHTDAVPLRNYDPEKQLLHGLSSQTLGVLLAQGLLVEDTPVYDRQHRLIGIAGEITTPSRVSFFNIWLMVCGALAVCALLLPGISGSYILTLLGVYPVVIEALVDFINSIGRASFNSDAFAVLASLGLGILLGALAFARGVSWLLKEYPNFSLAVLSGFMIGAIRSVWPFWSHDYIILPLKLQKGPQLAALDPFIPSLSSPLLWQAALCTVAGFILVFALEHLTAKKASL